MSQQHDPYEYEGDVSSQHEDDDVLNPEDIDMEDMSHFPARQSSSTHEGDIRSEILEHNLEESGDSFDESMRKVGDEVQDDLVLHEYRTEVCILPCQ